MKEATLLREPVNLKDSQMPHLDVGAELAGLRRRGSGFLYLKRLERDPMNMDEYIHVTRIDQNGNAIVLGQRWVAATNTYEEIRQGSYDKKYSNNVLKQGKIDKAYHHIKDNTTGMYWLTQITDWDVTGLAPTSQSLLAQEFESKQQNAFVYDKDGRVISGPGYTRPWAYQGVTPPWTYNYPQESYPWVQQGPVPAPASPAEETQPAPENPAVTAINNLGASIQEGFGRVEEELTQLEEADTQLGQRIGALEGNALTEERVREIATAAAMAALAASRDAGATPDRRATPDPITTPAPDRTDGSPAVRPVAAQPARAPMPPTPRVEPAPDAHADGSQTVVENQAQEAYLQSLADFMDEVAADAYSNHQELEAARAEVRELREEIGELDGRSIAILALVNNINNRLGAQVAAPTVTPDQAARAPQPGDNQTTPPDVTPSGGQANPDSTQPVQAEPGPTAAPSRDNPSQTTAPAVEAEPEVAEDQVARELASLRTLLEDMDRVQESQNSELANLSGQLQALSEGEDERTSRIVAAALLAHRRQIEEDQATAPSVATSAASSGEQAPAGESASPSGSATISGSAAAESIAATAAVATEVEMKTPRRIRRVIDAWKLGSASMDESNKRVADAIERHLPHIHAKAKAKTAGRVAGNVAVGLTAASVIAVSKGAEVTRKTARKMDASNKEAARRAAIAIDDFSQRNEVTSKPLDPKFAFRHSRVGRVLVPTVKAAGAVNRGVGRAEDTIGEVMTPVVMGTAAAIDKSVAGSVILGSKGISSVRGFRDSVVNRINRGKPINENVGEQTSGIGYAIPVWGDDGDEMDEASPVHPRPAEDARSADVFSVQPDQTEDASQEPVSVPVAAGAWDLPGLDAWGFADEAQIIPSGQTAPLITLPKPSDPIFWESEEWTDGAPIPDWVTGNGGDPKGGSKAPAEVILEPEAEEDRPLSPERLFNGTGLFKDPALLTAGEETPLIGEGSIEESPKLEDVKIVYEGRDMHGRFVSPVDGLNKTIVFDNQANFSLTDRGREARLNVFKYFDFPTELSVLVDDVYAISVIQNYKGDLNKALPQIKNHIRRRAKTLKLRIPNDRMDELLDQVALK